MVQLPSSYSSLNNWRDLVRIARYATGDRGRKTRKTIQGKICQTKRRPGDSAWQAAEERIQTRIPVGVSEACTERSEVSNPVECINSHVSSLDFARDCST